MILSKLKLVPKLARLRACSLCTQVTKDSHIEPGDSFVEDEKIVENTTKPRKEPVASKGHLRKIAKFFNTNKHLLPYKEYIPKKFLEKKTQNPPEAMYLVCDQIAKSVAAHVLPAIGSEGASHIVAETSPGLGLITKELVQNNVMNMRLYENSSEFHLSLQEVHKDHLERLELYPKDIFNLHKCAYMDRQDRGNRVASLLKDVPKRSWSAGPAMTIIGGMPNLGFLRFLLRSLAIQNEVTSYGKLQIFAIMRPADYAVMSASPDQSSNAYKYWSILLQLYLDFEILDKYERKFFLPWTFDTVSTTRYPLSLDPDLLYLVRINFKTKLPLDAEGTLQFFHFVKQFYGKGSRTLIPVIEKWVPDCGVNILIPKQKHEDYFPDIGIFTKFGELTPKQVLAVFKEMIAFPTYPKSPFMAMVENELTAAETVETDLHDEFEKTVNKDLEDKVDEK